MTFTEFVAIRQSQVPEASIDYKAAASFLTAARRHPGSPLEDQLRVWIAAMIDKGAAPSTRKRYVEKLSTIYKDFNGDANTDGDPFGRVRPLRDLTLPACGKDICGQSHALCGVFLNVMHDAKSNPAIALFLYMLLYATPDIEKAVSLRTDEYIPIFPQLDEIIDPAAFHHRRRYVFPLSQTRKRMPQLVREVLKEIGDYLALKGIKFSEAFSPLTVVAMWTVKARQSGVSLSSLASVLDVVPPEFGYLKFMTGATLSEAQKLSVKKNVAEAFCPTTIRWYAMKLRRGVSFDEVRQLIEAQKSDDASAPEFFYPMKPTFRKVGRKVVKDFTPYIEDVLFIQTRQSHVCKIDRAVRHEGYGWMFRQTANPGSDYSVIDRVAMSTFQRAVGVYTPDIKVELTRERPIGVGRKVRITGGVFAGYTGIIHDVVGGDADGSRRIFLRLSEEYGIKVELKIEDYLVEPLLLSAN